MILADALKARMGAPWAFGVTFVPVALMLFGADSLFAPPRHRGVTQASLDPDHSALDDADRWGVQFVRLGFFGAVVVLLMQAYGAWQLATMPPRSDRGLFVVGTLVGVPLAVMYVYSAMRWLGRSDATPETFSPMEPR